LWRESVWPLITAAALRRLRLASVNSGILLFIGDESERAAR